MSFDKYLAPFRESRTLPDNSLHKKVKLLSHVQLFVTPWTADCNRAPLSMGFSMQEYWSGLPFPFPGDPSNRGTEPGSPALWVDALLYEPPGKFLNSLHIYV